MRRRVTNIDIRRVSVVCPEVRNVIRIKCTRTWIACRFESEYELEGYRLVYRPGKNDPISCTHARFSWNRSSTLASFSAEWKLPGVISFVVSGLLVPFLGFNISFFLSLLLDFDIVQSYGCKKNFVTLKCIKQKLNQSIILFPRK